MVDRDEAAKLEGAIQAVIDELGVSWEAATVLVAVRNGDAMVGDVVFESSIDRMDPQPIGASAAPAIGVDGPRRHGSKRRGPV